MKHKFNFLILILFILIYLPKIHAQYIGGNGEGLTETYTSEDLPYLNALSGNKGLYVRWPGGSNAKVAFPSLDKPGLGMQKELIEKLYDEFTDENGLVKQEALEKDLRKADMEKRLTKSDLLDIIEISRGVNNFKIMYALNVMTGTVESNISAIQTLLDSGVQVISVVAGNETYISYNANWEKYVKDFEPILKACAEKFPDIERILCISSQFDKKHASWDNELVKYVNANGSFISGTDVHLYQANELKQATLLHPGKIHIQQGVFYPDLDQAFKKYIELTKMNSEADDFIAWYKKTLPEKTLYCSEFGDKPADYWSNTIANAGHSFEIFCKYKNEFTALMLHNLLGKWLWASRSPAGKLDVSQDSEKHLNRCHYYAILLANELPESYAVLSQDNVIETKGDYYFYFNTAGATELKPDFSLNGNHISRIEVHLVSGEFPYSSAGGTGFMTKDSTPSYEVQGVSISISQGQITIPANAFGYIIVSVE